jgi:hypothetical protein
MTYDHKPQDAPATVMSADGKTVLYRYRVDAVIFTTDRASAQARLDGDFFLDSAALRLPPWSAAVNGTGKYAWFVARGHGAEFDSVPVNERYHLRADGQLRRFASHRTAQAAADKLNAEEK